MAPRAKQATDPLPPPDVPPEVQQYYDAEKRDRGGLAWLLAAGSIIVVLALLAGAFFGGRWVYRKAHDKGNGSSQVATTKTTNGPSVDGAPRQQTTNPATGSTKPGTSKTDNKTTPTPAPTPPSTPATGAATTPATGAASSNLPSTGPADTLRLFVTVAILGMVAHQVYLRRFATR